MEWFAGLALVAVVVVVRHLAIRRVAHGDRRFVWVYFAPTLLMFAYLTWTGIGLWRIQPVLAIGVVLIGVASLVLYIRVVRAWASAAGAQEMEGDLGSPFFDLIVWTAIGVPMLMVVWLLILLVTGGFGDTR